jgi:NAD-dependent deacetylase
VSDPFDAAVRALVDRTRILVFTGAGISTESGIPDFRGPQGIWTRIDPDEYTFSRYVSDPAFRRDSWGRRFDSPFVGAEPNRGHRAVVDLWRSGRSVGCVTQNVDGLHVKGGLPSATVAELHGNASRIGCISCGDEPPLASVRERWGSGEADPACQHCTGILKPKIVFFGEDLPREAMNRAADMVHEADAVLVVGSTLSVYPAAFIPLDVVDRGNPMVIINQGRTDHDALATARVDGPAGTVLPALVAAITNEPLRADGYRH